MPANRQPSRLLPGYLHKKGFSRREERGFQTCKISMTLESQQRLAQLWWQSAGGALGAVLRSNPPFLKRGRRWVTFPAAVLSPHFPQSSRWAWGHGGNERSESGLRSLALVTELVEMAKN